MDDQQLLRYSRQIMLPQIDLKGQQALLAAKVLVIGIGGLGTPVALYLAASGVGNITIADPEQVELSNLQRQIAYAADDIGSNKVTSCKNRIRQLNSLIDVNDISYALTEEKLFSEVENADIVVDCTDNLASRFEINRACVKKMTPLVSAASIRWEGQITVIHPGHADSPCYHCFHDETTQLDQSCSSNGIVGPVVGVIGSMQAIEVIKYIVNTGELLIGRVLLFDALTMQWQTMQLKKNPHCIVCNH